MAAGIGRRLSPSSRVGVLTLVLAAAASGSGLFVWRQHWTPALGGGSPPLVALVALAGAFAVLEVFVIHLEYRHEVHSLSLSELALVPGLILFPPSSLLVAHTAGFLVAFVLHRHQWSIKLPFNLAQQTLTVIVAILVYRSVLFSHPALSAMGGVAAVATGLTVAIVGMAIVCAAISLHEGRLQTALLRGGYGIGAFASLVTSSLGVLACAVIWTAPGLCWLLVVVVAVACGGFRAYASLRSRYASLERLHSYTRSVATSADRGQAMELLLAKAADLLRAEVSEITLFDDDGTTGLRSTSVGGRLDTVTVLLRGDTSLEMLATAKGSAMLAPRLSDDSDIVRGLAERGFKDAVLIPLWRNGVIVGTFLVANRMGHVTTFDGEDLKLLETVGLHASTTLENDRLVDQLREEANSKEHQSLHDQLTGLPNRTLFHRVVEAAIDKAKEQRRMVGVMLIDLDRFKEVNDTLGHHTGDLLLVELSNRLGRLVGGRGHIARLGGDEFAIVLPDVAAPAEAEGFAQEILTALEAPLPLADINLQVGASIGVALYPDHAGDSAALLQLADVAMYQAKTAHSGYSVYTPERDTHNARRLALASDLRSAIEHDDLVVYYQPKADVRLGRITGVEALVRWRHRQFGLVPPDEFVSLAEQTGLIRRLTDYVLQTALRQCQAWQRIGFPLSVAVNLSVRNLVERDLPERIADLLDEVGLPANVLTLEITESTIMADPSRTLEILHQLAAMGTTLAIDDFGTGYSSLSYLKRLPVHEVKIDKSFVHDLASNGDDQTIVRSVVDLARNLNLAVVAEGVEDARTWDRLAELGCDSIQGFYLSRPLPAGTLTHLLLMRGSDVDRWLTGPGRVSQSLEPARALRMLRS